jgi:predicted nucleotidyltransferase
MVAMSEIQALADKIALEFNPNKIILYGSYAYGEPGPDSDVDLLVVLSFQGKTWRIASEIRKYIRPLFPLDILVRSPEQLTSLLDQADFFMNEILQKGRILYEA